VEIRRAGMDMLHGSLWDKILWFTVPLALTSMLQQLYNTTDVMVLGRFEGEAAMAALGTNIPVIGLLVNLFVGVSLGANVVAARYIGMRDYGNANLTVYTALNFALFCGIAVALPGIAFSGAITSMLGCPPDVAPLSVAYLSWIMAGMPFLSLFNFEAALLRADGDTATPLKALVLASAFNLASDLVCTGWLGLGFSGVAASTSAANALSALYLFAKLLRNRGVLRFNPARKGTFEWRKARAIIFIGLPAGIQGMVFSVSNLVIQSAINSLGEPTMAASAAAFTIEINAYSFVAGFGMAATTFVGQNYGAGNLERCRRAVRDSMLLDAAATVIICGSVALCGTWLLGFFTDDPEVIELGMQRLIWVQLFDILCVPFEVLSGAMRGYGWSLPPAMATLVCIVGERMIWVFTVFRAWPSFRTLLITYPVSWAVALPPIIALYMILMRRLSRADEHGRKAPGAKE
jgi:putative MATE family efflux protein